MSSTELVEEQNRLVSAALSGDQSAFTQLIRINDPQIRAVIYAMTQDRELHDEILQEAYVKAYRKLSTFRKDSSFATWLHRIAVNTALDELRKHKRDQSRRSNAEFDITTVPVSSDDPSLGIDIIAGLARLTERQRAIVILVDGHGYDYTEVGRMIGAPAGTVGFILHQARKLLRKQLSLGDS